MNYAYCFGWFQSKRNTVHRWAAFWFILMICRKNLREKGNCSSLSVRKISYRSNLGRFLRLIDTIIIIFRNIFYRNDLEIRWHVKFGNTKFIAFSCAHNQAMLFIWLILAADIIVNLPQFNTFECTMQTFCVLKLGSSSIVISCALSHWTHTNVQ